MNFIERQGHNQKINELRPPSKQIVLFLCDSSLIILLTVHTVLHRDPTRHIEDTTRKDTRVWASCDRTLDYQRVWTRELPLPYALNLFLHDQGLYVCVCVCHTISDCVGIWVCECMYIVCVTYWIAVVNPSLSHPAHTHSTLVLRIKYSTYYSLGMPYIL